ncbi:MAG: Gfo/Idh/MocA family oxidoreductase [Actinomycetota bacterium]
MDTVRLGVVGIGWWGGVLTESARESGLAEVVACFARSVDTREAFAKEHGCRAASSLEDILDDPEIDGLLVATPHSTHLEMVERAAAAGKHVFVEKPLTLTVAEAKRSIAATEAAGVILQVGHNRRRQPANRLLKELIGSGELGTVLQLEGNQSGPGGHKPALPGWRRTAEECPAGGMTGLGVHIVDTFNYFVGPAKRVTAFSKRIHGFLPLDEATTVILEYESGPLGYIGTSYFVPAVNVLSVYGSDGNAWNEEDGTRLFTQERKDPARIEREVDTVNTIVDELAEFARCIRDGTTPETGAAQGLEVAAVLEAIDRSVASGCAVELADLR